MASVSITAARKAVGSFGTVEKLSKELVMVKPHVPSMTAHLLDKMSAAGWIVWQSDDERSFYVGQEDAPEVAPTVPAPAVPAPRASRTEGPAPAKP